MSQRLCKVIPDILILYLFPLNMKQHKRVCLQLGYETCSTYNHIPPVTFNAISTISVVILIINGETIYKPGCATIDINIMHSKFTWKYFIRLTKIYLMYILKQVIR